ncbi:MAG: DUF2384 domain-containing protein [Flavobacteriales bacterium]|nr:DUF2384 domain-containing protein [Flavobacteriales bacterium]
MSSKHILQEPTMTYGNTNDSFAFSLISLIRNGIGFQSFLDFVKNSPFNLQEWASFLHISERTMQRYQKTLHTFDTPQSEKIVQIAMLYNLGLEIFGNKQSFDTWLNTENIALGHIKPKSLLDNTFGIALLKDELQRIEYGTLA